MFSSNSTHMHSDESVQTVFDTHSILNNPAKNLLDSEPSSTIFSRPLFAPITPPIT